MSPHLWHHSVAVRRSERIVTVSFMLINPPVPVVLRPPAGLAGQGDVTKTSCYGKDSVANSAYTWGYVHPVVRPISDPWQVQGLDEVFRTDGSDPWNVPIT